MPFSRQVLMGIFEYGFEKPPEVHKKVIVPFIQGRDIIVLWKSGTTRTTTYILGILQKLDYGKLKWQALILVSTRELAYGTSHVYEM